MRVQHTVTQLRVVSDRPGAVQQPGQGSSVKLRATTLGTASLHGVCREKPKQFNQPPANCACEPRAPGASVFCFPDFLVAFPDPAQNDMLLASCLIAMGTSMHGMWAVSS